MLKMVTRTVACLSAFAGTRRWCCFQSNLTSLTNQANRNSRLLKYGSAGTPSGIPRIPRLSTKSIAVLHETPHIMVAGRNHCNGFDNNQFLVISKQTKHCIFVDACDDWPDDWAAFLAAGQLVPTHVFLTHCHIDNIVNLNALLFTMEQHFHRRIGIMWCVAEEPWVDAFPRACERYGRVDEMRQPLPLLRNTRYSHFTYAHHLLERQRQLEEQQRLERAELRRQQRRRAGLRPTNAEEETEDSDLPAQLVPQLVRDDDILLSCATNRSTSFFEFGTHCTLHYLFTPGHSPGHMMLSLPRERLLFTGDVLHYNGIGRVDLPWATGERLAESLLALEDFPDSTVLLPGHGRLSTLGRERRENRALRSLYERRELGQQEVSVGFNTGYL